MTRFARALGCKDVRELKMKLAQSLAVGQRFILDVPDLEGVQGIYESIIGVLETNRRALDIEALKRAVSWLSDARQILAIGMGGGSTICAQEIQYRLFRLGLPVVSQNDGLLVRMMSSAVTPKDVVIVLSLGGYTKEMIESAAIARQYGAKVIAITPAGTPLADQADLVLPLLVREKRLYLQTQHVPLCHAGDGGCAGHRTGDGQQTAGERSAAPYQAGARQPPRRRRPSAAG
ncbi:Als operon repressor [Raoultella ornithinolytica]|nr:Als operon repressor [Raoultella ornithinolytica]